MLSLPPLLFEKYLSAAETIAEIDDSSPGVAGGPGYFFADLDVSGGTEYFYVVVATDGGALPEVTGTDGETVFRCRKVKDTRGDKT